jgi:hypothetical protein
MKKNIFCEILRVDKNHQIHLNVPKEMGEEVEVILMPLSFPKNAKDFSSEELLKIAAYVASVGEDAEEDTLWESYTHE